MARYEFSEWGTLIGPNNVPILRGYIGTYAYSARTENKNVAIRVSPVVRAAQRWFKNEVTRYNKWNES